MARSISSRELKLTAFSLSTFKVPKTNRAVTIKMGAAIASGPAKCFSQPVENRRDANEHSSLYRVTSRNDWPDVRPGQRAGGHATDRPAPLPRGQTAPIRAQFSLKRLVCFPEATFRARPAFPAHRTIRPPQFRMRRFASAPVPTPQSPVGQYGSSCCAFSFAL